MGEQIGTDDGWAERRKIVLQHVYYDMSKLIREAQNKEIGTSLAVLKPKKVIDFVWEPTDREWDARKLDSILARQKQLSLFEKDAMKNIFRVAKKLPYEFSYVFTTEDGVERKLMIEDWELGQLYWNCLKAADGNEIIACNKVKKKFFDEFVASKDLHFFLGTTKRFHNIGKNPFIIIGTFYPPKISQLRLDL